MDRLYAIVWWDYTNIKTSHTILPLETVYVLLLVISSKQFSKMESIGSKYLTNKVIEINNRQFDRYDACQIISVDHGIMSKVFRLADHAVHMTNVKKYIYIYVYIS